MSMRAPANDLPVTLVEVGILAGEMTILDDISLTLRHADEITGFEQDRADWLPTAAQVG